MDLASLRAQQIELASSVIREDRLDKDPPDLIAGADVGFEQGGEDRDRTHLRQPSFCHACLSCQPYIPVTKPR